MLAGYAVCKYYMVSIEFHHKQLWTILKLLRNDFEARSTLLDPHADLWMSGLGRVKLFLHFDFDPV